MRSEANIYHGVRLYGLPDATWLVRWEYSSGRWCPPLNGENTGRGTR
jgi:hypothetical protein